MAEFGGQQWTPFSAYFIKNDMKIIVENNKNTVVLDADKVNVEESFDLLFKNATQSYNAFQKLKEIGIRCYHAGINAPCGASVMIYRMENKKMSITI